MTDKKALDEVVNALLSGLVDTLACNTQEAEGQEALEEIALWYEKIGEYCRHAAENEALVKVQCQDDLTRLVGVMLVALVNEIAFCHHSDNTEDEARAFWYEFLVQTCEAKSKLSNAIARDWRTAPAAAPPSGG